MPELTVAQAYALDARFGWLWYLGATRKVRNRLGVRFIGEPWKQQDIRREGDVKDADGSSRPTDHHDGR